ncbi:uncharacterized protein PG986_005093 [Apiospora aurea]|uniref:Uncharacterized protein n=1 Tax=Apiospora aurea TaxID=335848 RepID=A0ABR1QI14_9PEZI
MASSQMLTAVLQSTVLQTIGEIAAHHLSEGAYDGTFDDPVFQDWSVTVMNRTAPLSSSAHHQALANTNTNSTALALTGGALGANITAGPPDAINPKSFYGHYLPRGWSPACSGAPSSTSGPCPSSASSPLARVAAAAARLRTRSRKRSSSS